MVSAVGPDDPPEIPVDEFVTQWWQYGKGEHVSLFGPTGVGKTTLAFKLMTVARHDHPVLRAVALVMKPDKGPRYKGRNATGDETIQRLTKAYGGRTTRVWPPLSMPWHREPTLWAYWPRHDDDPDIVSAQQSVLFRRCIVGEYRTGASILFADEVMSLNEELRLGDTLNIVWTKGRSMECGLWGATQRPAFVPRNMYSQASHLFLWSENDHEARKRYGEIGRVNPKRITAILDRLTKFQCLYLHTDHPGGPRWAILG